ncbi:MAG: PhoH family protein [Lachnospiraceae bacterium]|nr:PhoH family protein [Lachnospiraceae bacterium]
MFPDIEYASVGVDEVQWQVFDIDDGKNVSAFIKRIAAGAVETLQRLEYKITDDMYPSADDVVYLADLLRGDFDHDVPLKVKQKYTEDGLLALTNEQALCIEQLADNPRALIRGTAGTGKTLLAIESVKQAIANGERVAFFCFNKLLGVWLENYFSDVPMSERPMYAGNFHSYMINLLKEGGINPSPSSGKMDDYYYSEELPDMVIQRLKSIAIKYDRIVIDEAQDLVKSKYLEVMDLSLRNGLCKGKWTMFGDFSMQSIYSNNMTESAYLECLQDRAFLQSSGSIRIAEIQKKSALILRIYWGYRKMQHLRTQLIHQQ